MDPEPLNPDLAAQALAQLHKVADAAGKVTQAAADAATQAGAGGTPPASTDAAPNPARQPGP